MKKAEAPDVAKQVEKSWFCNCFVSKITKNGLLQLVEYWVEKRQKGNTISAMNMGKLVMMQKDVKLADYLRNSTIIIADGFPVYWAPRILGDPIPERITGVELMEDLLHLADKNHFRVYFL